MAASFCRFKIYVSHFAVCTDIFPKHFSLIMTEVNAVDMFTCVFALYIAVVILSGYMDTQGKYTGKKNNISFHSKKSYFGQRYA